jgi:hypothetical protein
MYQSSVMKNIASVFQCCMLKSVNEVTIKGQWFFCLSASKFGNFTLYATGGAMIVSHWVTDQMTRL